MQSFFGQDLNNFVTHDRVCDHVHHVLICKPVLLYIIGYVITVDTGHRALLQVSHFCIAAD